MHCLNIYWHIITIYLFGLKVGSRQPLKSLKINKKDFRKAVFHRCLTCVNSADVTVQKGFTLLPPSPILFPGVRRWTTLFPLLCHQAADGKRAHWLHHRRGALLTQWGQAHQATDWLQDAGERAHLDGFWCAEYDLRDNEEKGSGWVTGHEMSYSTVRLSLSRLICRGHEGDDLTSWSHCHCQGGLYVQKLSSSKTSVFLTLSI